MQVALDTMGAFIDAKDANNKANYFCPRCEKKVILCKSNYKKDYFAHEKKTNNLITGHGQTDRHKIGKYKILKYLKQKGVTVQEEVYISDIKRRADILAEINGYQYAIEYQCSPISLDEITKRTKAYQDVNIKPVWIAGPRYLEKQHMFATTQKFGEYSYNLGWWMIGWDACKNERPVIISHLRKNMIGNIIYQKQPLHNPQQMSKFIRKLSLQDEVKIIERNLIGNKMDKRYLLVHQQCYEHGYSLMGCPWVVHFPRTCEDFVNQEVPILNRVVFLLKAERELSEEDFKKVDRDFLKYLYRRHWLYRVGAQWKVNSKIMLWYPDAKSKLINLRYKKRL